MYVLKLILKFSMKYADQNKDNSSPFLNTIRYNDVRSEIC